MFVSADGGSEGMVGARRFAERYVDRQKVEAALVLDDLGAADPQLPYIVPWSTGSSRASLSAVRDRSTRHSRARPERGGGSESWLGQFVHLAWPLTLREQGPLVREGIDAVTLTARAELPRGVGPGHDRRDLGEPADAIRTGGVRQRARVRLARVSGKAAVPLHHRGAQRHSRLVAAAVRARPDPPGRDHGGGRGRARRPARRSGGPLDALVAGERPPVRGHRPGRAGLRADRMAARHCRRGGRSCDATLVRRSGRTAAGTRSSLRRLVGRPAPHRARGRAAAPAWARGRGRRARAAAVGRGPGRVRDQPLHCPAARPGGASVPAGRAVGDAAAARSWPGPWSRVRWRCPCSRCSTTARASTSACPCTAIC